MILTATLTTQVGRVACGIIECRQLIDEILHTEHTDWETLLAIGDMQYYSDPKGPYPNHQLRISASPARGVAALSYTDHDDPTMTIANSFNAGELPFAVDLIFNGDTGAVFPQSAAIPIEDAHAALTEWLTTRKRPTCIKWVPYDEY